MVRNIGKLLLNRGGGGGGVATTPPTPPLSNYRAKMEGLM